MKTLLSPMAAGRALTPAAIYTVLACFLAVAASQAASVIQFPVSSCTVTEGMGRLEIPVQRRNDTNAVVSVEVATAPLTAIPGADYVALATNLTFQAGETKRTVFIPILKHGRVGMSRAFKVLLRGPSDGVVLGSPTNLTVNILNGNKGLHFYVPALSVNEDAGQVVIKVARGDDGDSRMTVDYATADGTAQAGHDYTPVTGTIAFEPGEVLKSFVVPIINDTRPETNKTFRVILTNPTGGGVLGSPSSATVTIKDTDRAFQFDSASYLAREDVEFFRIGIIQGENDASATVDFTTTDGTAIAGLDYVGVTNTIAFGAGERLKWVMVPILHDSLQEPRKTFRVTLSNPTGGAVLVFRQSADITITDNDPGVGFATNTFRASESAGVANVTVARGSDERLLPFTVDYQTTDGSAHAGVDYRAASGTLQFKANETLQTITIPILQNSTAKEPKTFTVSLSHASDGVSLGTAITSVKILHPGGYYPILLPIDAKPKLRQEDGVNLLSWEGAGALQCAEQVTGPWEDLPGAASPYAIRPVLPLSFYRIQSARPTEVYVPSGYDGKNPMPLILALHPMGMGANGGAMRIYFPLEPLAESRGFLLCYPSGTVDAGGRGFWNGTDVLGFSGPDVDDSGYLRGLIEEIQRRFVVDPKRIYVTGYSSGGNMSQRLACEHADLIAGIAAMTGVGIYYDPNCCHSTEPVHVLQIQGTADSYLGWQDFGDPVVGEGPGAVRTVQIWAGLNGCSDPVVEAVPSLDVTTQVAGLDTTVLRYTQCPPGGSVELWTVNGGDHFLFFGNLAPHFLEYLVDWLLAHPKP